MVEVGLYVRLEAKAGKEGAVEAFLRGGLEVVEEEPATVAWFALRLGPSTFGIFDAFPDEAGREATSPARTSAPTRPASAGCSPPASTPCRASPSTATATCSSPSSTPWRRVSRTRSSVAVPAKCAVDGWDDDGGELVDDSQNREQIGGNGGAKGLPAFLFDATNNRLSQTYVQAVGGVDRVGRWARKDAVRAYADICAGQP